jgi:hypothetical protein
MTARLDIDAMSEEAMQVMLADGTILPIRTLHTEDGKETDNWAEAKSMLVVDFRGIPPLLMSVKLDAIQFSPEC